MGENVETDTFGDRLGDIFDRLGQLCVGIDPHPYLLALWGLPDTASGLREFGMRVVEATIGSAGIIKPQVAFFERHGSAGYAALEAVLSSARETGILVIADVKRGDVGTSVDAYGQAWLSPGGPLECDAMTVSAYQGVDSLAQPMKLALAHGKGLFVLAATSNPEAREVQLAATASGVSVASSIVRQVAEFNRSQTDSLHGSIGLVLGATVEFADYGIDLELLAARPSTPVLAPGFGYQGARFSDLVSRYGPAAPFAVVTASRSILEAGPSGISAAIGRLSAEVDACRD